MNYELLYLLLVFGTYIYEAFSCFFVNRLENSISKNETNRICWIKLILLMGMERSLFKKTFPEWIANNFPSTTWSDKNLSFEPFQLFKFVSSSSSKNCCFNASFPETVTPKFVNNLRLSSSSSTVCWCVPGISCIPNGDLVEWITGIGYPKAFKKCS